MFKGFVNTQEIAWKILKQHLRYCLFAQKVEQIDILPGKLPYKIFSILYSMISNLPSGTVHIAHLQIHINQDYIKQTQKLSLIFNLALENFLRNLL